MTAFTDVTLTKKANIYFDGNVTSRSFVLADGSKKSLGIMLQGEYEFSTDAKEIMEILSGELEILLPDAKDWKTITGGDPSKYRHNQHSGSRLERLSITAVPISIEAY